MGGGKRYARILHTAVVLGATIVSMDARAQLQSFERLVMPGPVIAGHAEYEGQCASCHVRFERQQQRDLCLDCHTEIAEDLRTSTGFHSLSIEARDGPCATCHADHEGRDADIVGLDEATFDHGLTDFPLRDSHAEALCEDCHAVDALFHDAATECVACHRDDDQHMGNLGEACADCHAETTWSDAHYDHELESGYALTGAHADLTCVSCHEGEVYVETPDQCVDCHRDDDTHLGTNGPECRDCHTTTDWAETLFDHFARTSFALTGGHSGLMCESCHTGNKFEQTLDTECVACHRDDDAHDGINGAECATCHRATEWLDVSFDHARDAEFPLNGAHAALECMACHFEPVAVSLPETECVGCHLEDDPHATQLGNDCGSCHAELTWTEDVRFDHDLTIFPLLGRHAEIVCEDCHATRAFHDAAEQCIECHEDDDVHTARLGSDCALCHTPLDWVLWRFDHDAQTDFALDGAHAGLDCHACHRTPVAEARISLPGTCISCHRSDDAHRGQFGDDCEECHTTESFDVLRTLR